MNDGNLKIVHSDMIKTAAYDLALRVTEQSIKDRISAEDVAKIFHDNYIGIFNALVALNSSDYSGK